MGPDDGAVRPGGRVPFVPSATLLARVGALGRGFDERLRYGEDVDLVWRLHDDGWIVRYDASVTVTHDQTQSMALMLQRRFRYGTAAAPLARRHPGRLAPARIYIRPTLTVLLLLHRRVGLAGSVALPHAVSLARRTSALGLPRALGVRWLGEATVDAAATLAQYAAGVGLPITALLAPRRGARAGILALLALTGLLERHSRRARLDPVRWSAIRLVDDAAYATGVHWGCLRDGRISPLVPTFAKSGRPSPPASGVVGAGH
jgi:hypothetical protein